MFDWLIDFFRSIGDIIVTLITLVIQTFTSIIQLIGLIPSYISYLAHWFALIPNFLFPFIIIIPTILIIWFLKKAGKIF